MAEEDDKTQKKKTPTAEKRLKQNVKRCLENRSFKSRVRTAIRSFESACSAGDKEKVKPALNAVHSLMDKGVKRGIFKKNKAARVKSHTAAKTHAIG